MPPLRLLALSLALLTLALPSPAAADDLCDGAVARLNLAMAASPDSLSPEVAEALAEALDACGAPRADPPLLRGGGPVTRLVCGPGGIAGPGPLLVVIATPPAAGVSYEVDAGLSYWLDATSWEEFQANAPTDTGFISTTAYGFGYVNGQPYPASDWGVSGACDKRNQGPCAGAGYVSLIAGPIEVWMSGALNQCRSQGGL